MVLGFGAKTNREAETSKFLQSSTTGHYLGPGSYDVERQLGASAVRSAANIPFQSSAARKFDHEISPSKQLPGPGRYNIDHDISVPKLPASAFHSKVERFKSLSISESAPGPGSYVVQDRLGAKGGPRFRSLADQTPSGAMWMRVPTAPSIPTKTQSYGYEEGGDHGELVMQRPAQIGHSGIKGDLAGPGSYDLRAHTLSADVDKKGKISDFSKGTKRMDILKMNLAAPNNPGPGAYNLVEPASNTFQPEAISEHFSANAQQRPKPKSSVFKSTTIRAEPTRPREKDKTPGPGDYELTNPENGFTKLYKQKEQSFGSTVERFRPGPRTSQRMFGGPGPGAYDVEEITAMLNHHKKMRRRQQQLQGGMGPSVGFDSTTTRLATSKSESQLARIAPGSYDIAGMAEDVQKKLRSRTGAFGSAQKRFAALTEDERPGPADYNTDRRLGASPEPGQLLGGRHTTGSINRGPAKSSMFASEEKRFIEPLEKAKLLVPPPTAYDLKCEWIRTNQQVPMDKGTERFKDPKLAYDTGIGPGTYNVKQNALNLKGTGNKNVMAKAPIRFQQPKAMTMVPGPGRYKTEHSTSLIKRTFNIAVAENCARL